MNNKLENNFKPLRKQETTNKTSNTKIYNDHHADTLRSKYSIEVDGENIPPPYEQFDDFKLPRRILNHLLYKKKFLKPTAIQMQAISCIIDKRDVIGLSSTGTGKTFAYLLPLCSFLNENKISKNNENSHNSKPYGLIIVPTRELVKQISELLEELLQLILNDQSNKRLNEYSNRNYNYRNSGQAPIYQQENNFSEEPFFHQNQNSAQKPIYYQNVNHNNINPGFHPYQHKYNSNSFGNQQSYFQNQVLNQNQTIFHQSTQNFNTNHPNLTTQINGHDRKTNFVATIIGGVPIKENLSQLNLKTKVIISTPGRLLDLYDKKLIILDAIEYAVFDECDRLLDMGLEEQLRKIIAIITLQKNSPQVSLWSATLPSSLERLARSAVINPIFICVGIKDSIPVNIMQDVKFTHSYLKPKLLLETLQKIPYPPVIIFTCSKEKTDEIKNLLFDEQFHVSSIHSGKQQDMRNEIMKDFKNNEFDILVATDLISRGLDIPIVNHVINYDIPDNIDDYIHRCGRTGRFGRPGTATTFLTLECKIAKELKEILESTKNLMPNELHDTKSFGKKVLKTEMGDRVINY